jgi:hypothetical protein
MYSCLYICFHLNFFGGLFEFTQTWASVQSLHTEAERTKAEQWMKERSRASEMSQRLGEFTKAKGQAMQQIMEVFANLEKMSLNNSQLGNVMQVIQALKREHEVLRLKTEASYNRISEGLESDVQQIMAAVRTLFLFCFVLLLHC